MPHTPTLSGESRVRSTAGELRAQTLSSESLRHQSDDRLVALTRGGSERAFAEITRRYQRQLRAYCSRLVGVERAQDAVQQALLQAFLNLRDGAPRQIALRPWLYRIAHNCSIDLLRMGSWDYEQLDLEFDGVPQPPALFEQKQELREMIDGMRRLPDAQRQALALRELEGCSYEEISARLGHTGSGVRQLIFRARTTLRNAASALLLPLGLLRERVTGMAPAIDSHHVAGAAAVPASSGGGGLETVGAAALAVVAVLGGVAGGVRGGGDQREVRKTRTTHIAPAIPAALSPPATARVTNLPVRPRSERAPRSDGGARPTPSAPSEPLAPLSQTSAPAPPLQTPAPAPVPADAAPPPAAPPAEGVVQQQAVAAEPGAPGTPGATPADQSPASVAPGEAGPATPTAGTAPKPVRPPAVKPKPPVSQAPARAPKPARPSAPTAAPALPKKASPPPPRPKKKSPPAPATAARR